jgi:hypothetical protein
MNPPDHTRFIVSWLGTIALACIAALNVTPVLSVNNEGNHPLGYPKALCDAVLGNAASVVNRTDFVHLDQKQFASLVIFSARHAFRVKAGSVPIPTCRNSPAFDVPIRVVICLSSQEQVGRVAARRVVALMQNVHPVRMSIVDSERYPVRLDLLPIQLHRSVAVVECCSIPRPAFVVS